MYAPTPYGEVCVDDDGEDEGDRFAAREAFASETARGERGLNPDWDVAIELGRASERLGTRDGTKFELCVYGARADGREGARGGETAKAGSARASGARWRCGGGLRTARGGEAGGGAASGGWVGGASGEWRGEGRVGGRGAGGRRGAQEEGDGTAIGTARNEVVTGGVDENACIWDAATLAQKHPEKRRGNGRPAPRRGEKWRRFTSPTASK